MLGLSPRLGSLEFEGDAAGRGGGVAAAWLFAAYFSEAIIRLAVGLIALGFALNSMAAKEARRRDRATQGQPRRGVGRTCRLHLDAGADRRSALFRVRAAAAAGRRCSFVGTTVWFFALVNAMKVAPYFALGQFSTSGCADLGGAHSIGGGEQHGRRLAGARQPEALFYKITNVLVLLIGLILTYQGVAELLG